MLRIAPVRDVSNASFLSEMLFTRFIVASMSVMDPIFLSEFAAFPYRLNWSWSANRPFFAALVQPIPVAIRFFRNLRSRSSMECAAVPDTGRPRGYFSLHVDEPDEPIWASTMFLTAWLTFHSVVSFVSACLALYTLRWTQRAQDDWLIGLPMLWNTISAITLLLSSARWSIIAPMISRRCRRSQVRGEERRGEEKCIVKRQSD